MFSDLIVAQIQAPYADYSDTAKYAGGNPDSLFVFNVDNEDDYVMVDADAYSGYTISWQAYKKGTGFVDLGLSSTQIAMPDTTDNLGLKLILSDTTDTIESVCWLMRNEFTMEVLTKDDDNNILEDALTSSNCKWLGYIEVEFTQNTLRYFDPSTHNAKTLSLDHTSTYETDVDMDDGFGELYEADKLNGNLRYGINNSWYEDAVYTITITDDSGYEQQDDLNVTAIRPYATDIDLELIPLNDKEYYPDLDSLYYYAYGDNYDAASGPAIYLMTNESFNADTLIWTFGDSTSLSTTHDSAVHEYMYWGDFAVTLKVINYFDFRKECSASFDVGEATVDKPSLSSDSVNAPNVISPPNGNNPIWRFDDVSITSIEVMIYNRWGQRVHYYKGDIRDWGGWDGTKNNSSNYVSTGVYYYVVKNFGVINSFSNETVDIDDAVRSGFIHVFNTE